MIGCDIIEIERIARAAERESFLHGVFTQVERDYYAQKGSKAQTLAGMFCAKEAVAKALGSGFCGFRPSDIEIRHDEHGAPVVRLYGKAEELAGGARWEISVSHCDTYAMAVAVKIRG